MYIYRFQNVFLRCPTPRLHCFLSSPWPSFRFLSFMAFLIPSIQFFFVLPRALFCFGIHFNAILGNLPSAILWTWPYHVSWFCSISFIIVSSNPICYLILKFNTLLNIKGARGGTVGWGTALQAGRSRVRFPMVSLEFFIDIILPATLWPWGWLGL